MYNILVNGKISCHCRDTSKNSCSLAFRIKQTNKQINYINQLFLYVQKSTDNCYLIPVKNKNSSFISEKKKTDQNTFLKYACVKITNGSVANKRICGVF